MKRFFAKLARYFSLRNIFTIMLVVGALVFVLYAEEDWRGAREWAATKAQWEAKGESFDDKKFVPPPVPDEQNLAALPVFKLEPVIGDNGESYLSPVTLRRALRSSLPGGDLPTAGSWMTGYLPNLGKIHRVVAENYSAAFKDTKPPGDTLAQFNALYPVLADLLAASASRPFYRLNEDYLIDPPDKRPLGPVTETIRIAHVLTLHAVLALNERLPDLALADLKLNHELFLGVSEDPSLVGGLVALGINAIGNAALYDGLTQHAWSDAQLAEIEQMLQSLDFLALYQHSLRGELIFCLGNLDFYRRMAGRFDPRGLAGAPKLETLDRLMARSPEGWWDMNESHIAAFYFRQLGAVDPRARRAFPQVPRDLYRESEQADAKWDAMAPWNIFSTSIEPNMSHASSKFAEGQVWVDQTRIACALERYRLAKGVYPDSLAALTPQFIDKVPHDIMNGEPYHYRWDGTRRMRAGRSRSQRTIRRRSIMRTAIGSGRRPNSVAPRGNCQLRNQSFCAAARAEAGGAVGFSGRCLAAPRRASPTFSRRRPGACP
jgi:hypothetical protein